MSAKRRQETIDRFCVPLDDNQNVLSSVDVCPSPSLHSSNTPGDTTDEDDFNTQTDDADFVEMGDDSISDCESIFPVNWKDKGKSKFKQTRKGIKPKPDELFYGDNPKVLLLSLKAGALGLNLTVANNVYLYDFLPFLNSSDLPRLSGSVQNGSVSRFVVRIRSFADIDFDTDGGKFVLVIDISCGLY
jgi:SWI/SNF-related matrix-associated actin-dependent regulator of chromatin subfamily A3